MVVRMLNIWESTSRKAHQEIRKAGNFMDAPIEGATHPARYWHPLADGRLQCDLCPRFCKLRDGQRGLCFVRARQGQEMVLTTYGRSSGFCIDPIEKKPLNHFYPGTPVLSFGTAGCNLACKFCQNWDISKSREIETLSDRADPETLAIAAQQLQCRSIAFTYNDPVIFLEYAVDVAEACRSRGIATVAVTAGEICPEPRIEFFAGMDAANVDLKAFNNDFYRKICGADLQPVLETLKYLVHETHVWVEITTLLIPGENDSDTELHALSQWVVEHLGPGVPLHFTAFHPDFKMLDKPRTPPQTLSRARDIAMKNGASYVYTGNVHDVEGGSTRCPSCRQIVIERDGYRLGRWGLTDNGSCVHCDHPIPGRFDGPPGTWGPRRQPVRLSGLSGLQGPDSQSSIQQRHRHGTSDRSE